MTWLGLPSPAARHGLGLLAAVLLLPVLLTGCSDDKPGTTGERSGKRVLVAALGDSITAGSPRWDPNPEQRGRIGGRLDRRSQYEYWAERASDGRVRFRNCGIPGNVTAHLARRLERCATGAQQLLIQGGGADIILRRGIRQAARNLERMVRRGKKLGLEVMIAEVVPFGGSLSWRRQTRRLNRIIRVIGERQQVRVLPFYETLEDPGNPGFYDPQLTEDYVHPSVEGHGRLGELLGGVGEGAG